MILVKRNGIALSLIQKWKKGKKILTLVDGVGERAESYCFFSASNPCSSLFSDILDTVCFLIFQAKSNIDFLSLCLHLASLFFLKGSTGIECMRIEIGVQMCESLRFFSSYFHIFIHLFIRYYCESQLISATPTEFIQFLARRNFWFFFLFCCFYIGCLWICVFFVCANFIGIQFDCRTTEKFMKLTTHNCRIA